MRNKEKTKKQSLEARADAFLRLKNNPMHNVVLLWLALQIFWQSDTFTLMGVDLRDRFKYETPCSSKKDISILHMRYLSDSGVFSAQLSVPFVCRLQSKAVKSY